MTDAVTEWGMRQGAVSAEPVRVDAPAVDFGARLGLYLSESAMRIHLAGSAVSQPTFILPSIGSGVTEQFNQYRELQARDLAHRFGVDARRVAPEASVWASYGPDFVVTVVLPEFDLDKEIALQEVFADLTRELLEDPGMGDLIIRLPVELERRDLVVGQRVA